MWSARKRAEVRRHFRLLRTANDLSQFDAALKAKISAYRYRLIELGYDEADAEEKARLAKTFQVSVDAVYPSEEQVSA